MFQMIVEHQPQNVIRTLSVRLADYSVCPTRTNCKRMRQSACVCLHCGRVHTFFSLFHYVFNVIPRWVFFSLCSAIQVSNLLSMPNRLPLLYIEFFVLFCSLYFEYVRSAVDVSMALECLFTKTIL